MAEGPIPVERGGMSARLIRMRTHGLAITTSLFHPPRTLKRQDRTSMVITLVDTNLLVKNHNLRPDLHQEVGLWSLHGSGDPLLHVLASPADAHRIYLAGARPPSKKRNAYDQCAEEHWSRRALRVQHSSGPHTATAAATAGGHLRLQHHLDDDARAGPRPGPPAQRLFYQPPSFFFFQYKQ